MDEPPEQVPPADIAQVDRDRLPGRCERWSQADGAMRPLPVEVLRIGPERPVKMAPTPDYEEDHLISLELGGNPRSSKNLWPEPHHVRVGGLDVGSYAKDGFENHLRSLVCAGRLSLASAQREIAGNWVAYWRSWKGI